MNTLFTNFQQTILEEGLLQKGDRVLVALSGGADSVALLKALSLLQEEYSLTLTAAHLHHGIRGEEADADCALAQEFCQTLGIPCVVQYANIPALCKQTGEGEEECGRRVRYEFFNSIENTDKIATAHTANDNAETLFLHLARGSGLQGLRGILPKRGKIIRPLIGCTRTQVEEFCEQHALVYAKDSTNKTLTYRRNYLRHKVLPLLEFLNPSYLESMARCATANQKDYDYLHQVGEHLLQKAQTPKGYLLSVLGNAHQVEQHYALQTLFQQEGIFYVSTSQWQEIFQLLKKGEGKCSLSGKVFLCVFQGLITLEKEAFPPPPPLAISLAKGTHCYREKTIGLEPIPSCEKVCNLLTYNHINGDTIGTSLYLRTRLPGDTITLPRRGCTKTLKKLFNELKIPHKERETALVLCDEQGIIWVEGIGCDARCAPTPEASTIWRITIQ